MPGAALEPVPENAALQEDLGRLAVLCEDAACDMPSHAAFRISHDSVNYRGVVVPSIGGKVFLLRRLENSIGTLAELGIPEAYVHRMLKRYLSGLVIVCGVPCSGRTTTASALVRDRLLVHGGLALTGEDPVELPLEGAHGNGVCFQTTAPRDPLRFGEVFDRLLRAGPSHILIDEVDTPEAAAAILQASVAGRLVIAVMRAEDIVRCLIKLHAMASAILTPENARALLATGLTAVLHQQMTMTLKSQVRLETEFLSLTDEPVPRTLLRNGEYESLETMLRQQRAALIAESRVINRFPRR